jgi:hypothetical protein
LIANCDFALPQAYESLLRYTSSSESFLCIEPWYFTLWSAEEVVSCNQGDHVEEFLPGAILVDCLKKDEITDLAQSLHR